MSDFWMIVNFAVNSVAILFVALMTIKIISFYVKALWSLACSFNEWIKKKWKEYKSETNLKQIYIFVAGLVGLALVILFIGLYYQVFWIPCDIMGICIFPYTDTFTLDETKIRNLAFAFLGTVSGIAALFGVYMAILRSEEDKRQNDTAEQGQITDRLNKAVEGLGKSNGEIPVVAVRLGALYALERIAKDSIRDHVQIMEILCAYVRTNSPSTVGSRIKEPKSVSEDIQTAITIIGRRGEWPDGETRLKTEKEQEYRIDLNGCNLHEVNIIDGNLHNAQLSGADLRGADLIRTDLSEAWLIDANLDGAWVSDADISWAWLDDATIGNADFEGAETDGIHSDKNDFSKCRRLTREQLDVMFCGIEVKIPKGWKRPKHWPTEKLSYSDFMDEYHKWLESI